MEGCGSEKVSQKSESIFWYQKYNQFSLPAIYCISQPNMSMNESKSTCKPLFMGIRKSHLSVRWFSPFLWNPESGLY